jgi:diguanylate cyclase (GGDEF)-like protein
VKRSLRQRSFGSLPTIVVFVVVLISGSRLIYLSVQHHAAIARDKAATVAAGFVSRIEPPLQRLAHLAGRQAATATEALSSTHPFSALGPVAPAKNTFWMTADDKVLGARTEDAAAASGIASEWQSAESARAAPGSAMLGPMRLGSEWLLAIRDPIAPPGGQPQSRGFAVAYGDLDELIAEAHLARLVDMGYAFELSQVDPRSTRPRVFVSTRTEPLLDSVAARIRLPVAAAVPGSYLQVAIRPRTGWFPASLLASEIGLLAFLTWMLSFGTHDLIHALQRSRAALSASRRRVHSINQHLAREMQQRLTLQETFDHARFHDAFTGLPNRRYFMDQLDRALRDVRTKRRQRIAVIIIDIARFKLINDMLGHTAGDELMVQAARRFEKSASKFEGLLARWGGDQFALLIPDIASTDAALDIAGLLLEQLRAPFQLRRHQLVVAATVGVTCADSGQQRAEDVVREADIALSVAKRQDSAKVVLYAPNMGGQAANLVSLEADLHVAIEKNQLRLLFQPIIDLRTGKMVGAEALLRWRHPVEGVLAPERFLRIAEEAGLMVPITRWIILRVVKLAGEWLRRLAAGQNFYITVNLSPTALRDPELTDYLGSLLKETRLPPALLKLELTEAALIGNVSAARETLNRLHSMGIQLMLDDFGTGYSSLSNLQLFPFDFVKIDCPFVNRTGSDQADMSIMAAMVQIAASLKLTTIAEIVESAGAAAAVQEMGCNYGQGFYFGEPIDAELAVQRLLSQEPSAPTDPTAETMMVRPLDEDTSQTMMMPSLSDPAMATSDTMKVRPLDEDSSPTTMMPSDSIKFPREEEEGEPH